MPRSANPSEPVFGIVGASGEQATASAPALRANDNRTVERLVIDNLQRETRESVKQLARGGMSGERHAEMKSRVTTVRRLRHETGAFVSVA